MSSLRTRLARTLSIGGAAGVLAVGGGLTLSDSAVAADAAIPGTTCTVTAAEAQSGLDVTGAVSCTGASQSASFTTCIQRLDGGVWDNKDCISDSGTADGGGFSENIEGFESLPNYSYRVQTNATAAGQSGSVVSDGWGTTSVG